MKKLTTLLLGMVLTLNSQGFGEDASTSEETFPNGSGFVSPLAVGMDLQFLPTRFPNYSYAPGMQTNRMGMGARLGLEYLPLEGKYGKGGIGAGVGFTRTSKVSVNGNGSWLETIPVDVYATYRFDYLDDQWFVPFVKAGFERHFARQLAAPEMTRYNGRNLGFGVAFLLDRLDSSSATQLDASTGINNTYLTFEYLISSQSGGSQINLARDEIRMGLRFEM